MIKELTKEQEKYIKEEYKWIIFMIMATLSDYIDDKNTLHRTIRLLIFYDLINIKSVHKAFLKNK